MAIKDVLLALTSYPDRTSDVAIRTAVAVAASLDARIAAIACETQVELPSTLLGDSLIDLSALAASEGKKSAQNVDAVLQTFSDIAIKIGLSWETIREKRTPAKIPQLFAEYARLRDLSIVPVPQEDFEAQWYLETIIFESGRPTLLIPDKWKREDQFKLGSVVVAWDFSRTAARAVADAIPLLQRAKNVYVLTVANEKKIDLRHSAVEIARHLANHGVAITVETVDVLNQAVGEVMQDYCIKQGADILVMGAYGHSRLREFVLGGATRHILSEPKLPIFMSH